MDLYGYTWISMDIHNLKKVFPLQSKTSSSTSKNKRQIQARVQAIEQEKRQGKHSTEVLLLKFEKKGYTFNKV